MSGRGKRWMSRRGAEFAERGDEKKMDVGQRRMVRREKGRKR